jgi:hypothetical protein
LLRRSEISEAVGVDLFDSADDDDVSDSADDDDDSDSADDDDDDDDCDSADDDDVSDSAVFDAEEDELSGVDDAESSAHATTGLVATAPLTPSTTAMAPTRPIYLPFALNAITLERAAGRAGEVADDVDGSAAATSSTVDRCLPGFCGGT